MHGLAKIKLALGDPQSGWRFRRGRLIEPGEYGLQHNLHLRSHARERKVGDTLAPGLPVHDATEQVFGLEQRHQTPQTGRIVGFRVRSLACIDLHARR